MSRRFPKKTVYGQYKEVYCTFCEKIATQYTENQLPVCRLHLKCKMEEFKCLCGSWLEQRAGRYGPYFNCIKCGIVNYKKGMEMRKLQPIPELPPASSVSVDSINHTTTSNNSSASTSTTGLINEPVKTENSSTRRRETTITTGDVEYFS